MNEIHSNISKQAQIAAACLLDSIKDANEINWNDICYTIAHNLQINNGDVCDIVGDASGILDMDIFDIYDLYFWAAARVALIEAARAIKIQIKISKYPNK